MLVKRPYLVGEAFTPSRTLDFEVFAIRLGDIVVEAPWHLVHAERIR